MSLNAKDVPYSGGDNNRPEVLDSGAYPVRLVQVFLLGVQPQRPFKGEDKPPKLEIMLTYEFLDEFMKDENGEELLDKPRWLSETIPFNNLDVDRAKSTQRYYALDPEVKHNGDWTALLGTPCMLTLVQEEGKGKNAGKKYENISSISAMRPKEAAKAPALVNKPRVFDFYAPDMEVYNIMPKWLKEKLQNAVDFGGGDLAKALGNKEEKTPAAKDDDLDGDEITW